MELKQISKSKTTTRKPIAINVQLHCIWNW